MRDEAPRIVLVRGTGSIGMRHIESVRALGHRVIAVPARASRCAELESLGLEVSSSMREAVDLGATAAIIATDTGRHVEDATEALALGCKVLVEKPLAPSASETRWLIERASAKRDVFVAYCLRFHSGMRLFRERLHEIGEVQSVRIVCQSYLPSWRPTRDYRESYSARAEEGGVLRDLSHEIDYGLWLFGAPTRMSAMIHRDSRLGIEAEEAADLSWYTRSGAAVSVRLDYITHRSRRSMLAQGTRGEIEWDAIANTVRLCPAHGRETIFDVDHDRDRMMQSQAAAFLRAMASDDGASGDVCTLAEGVRVVQLCDAARRSSETGQMISMEEPA